MQAISLEVLPDSYGICRFRPEEDIPPWAATGGFCSITRTNDELSILCREDTIPDGVNCEKGWRAFKLLGPFEFTEIGILAGILGPLSKAGISILAVSTFDTDYVFVKGDRLNEARDVMEANGFQVA